MLSVLLVLFTCKVSFAQDRMDHTDNGSNEVLVEDFYRVGDIPNHFYMEAQNYWAPQNPSAVIDTVKIWVRGSNGVDPDFYQEKASYPNDVIGDVNMDVYDLDFSNWNSVIVHWEMDYSDGTTETWEFEWDHGYWW